MKRIKLLILLVLLMPVVVFAEDISVFPSKIESNEGVIFTNYTSKYVGYVDQSVESISIDSSQFGVNYTIEGNSNIILNSETTIFNVKAISNVNKEVFYIIPIEIISRGKGEQNSTLSNLEVVGFKLDFKTIVNDYKVTVPSNVDQVYINAVPNSNNTVVNGAGIIKLNDKKTVVTIETYNEGIEPTKYTVTITKKNTTISIIVTMCFIFGIIIGILLFFFKKYSDKASTVNPDVLKREIKTFDVDEVIKEAKEKQEEKMNDISNESLTPGVLTPRTMIPEDQNK